LYKINKNKVNKDSSKRKTDLAYRQQQISNQEEEEEKKKETDLLYRKINFITKGCSKLYFNKILKKLAEKNSENANIICDYIIAEETELNIKNSTKESRIKVLVWLSNFHNDTKSFKQMTKQDILDYLNRLRRSTSEDSSQRWIGSYNGRQIILSKFFRWLCNPDEPDQRRRMTPPCMKGIKQLTGESSATAEYCAKYGFLASPDCW
jgi:hypothetical protein